MNIVHYMNMVHNTKEKNQTSSRVQRNRQKRLQRILDSALGLILEAGLDGLTMQKLARRMDYAVGALYRYFDSKDALLTEIQQQVLGAFLTVFETGDQAQASQPEFNALSSESQALARIVLAAQTYYQMKQIAPTRFRLISLIMGTPQSLLSFEQGQKVMAAAWPLLSHISTLLEAAQTEQALTPGSADDRGLIFWASVQGLLQLEKLQRFEPSRFDMSRLLQAQLDTLLMGWGASASALNPALEWINTFQSTQAYQTIFLSIQEEVSQS